ncbi:flagellar biosynthesis protein FlhA [Defluviimonas denitrificans]|jgi:flagellar biosynthesis protein FlhA|uniref:Flagellar biosynthesis protein FlhA n=1 Tax=Albidovulum denitrificans TaxID=404881 RepID=A0A2S8S8J2_9RHOB|nr:flagellar biosynthesis protein FlhA [Defluviimonas denitrificans]PQV57106.1 flagellar biosynthesis protein FlhA [Defluviimonas denitrificans]
MSQVQLSNIFKPTVLLALALMAVIIMMILPMPAWVLDVGLAASFALAILMFTITLFIERPLDFSAFPTILLASLMLRLSLNVSSTKLIIGQGHTGTSAAGKVIEGFASFIMSGSILIGLVVFGVLLIVNFIVITKGAGRMAEVGARFALDGMPGKQLAIDSDMNAGAIDHAEAKARREREQAETTFFGSLDGASKFVKGDAVAGLLITLLNIVVGLVIGVAVHGMPFGRAFETYAILTVGDGLVSQIPAVIISIATALLLSRGGATGAADRDLLRQLGRYPAALGTVAFLMGLFAFVPGLPFLPFLAGALALGGAAVVVQRQASRQAKAEAAAVEEAPATPRQKSMGDILDLDEINVEFAPSLIAMVLDPGTGIEARIANMRKHVAMTYGLILPEIRLTDNALLERGEYRIRIHGVEQARDRLFPDHVLALIGTGDTPLPDGQTIAEPVYGAPARWLALADQEGAVLAGATVVGPVEVLATHLLEIIRRNLARLLTLKAVRRLLEESTNLSIAARGEANRKLYDELIPEKVPVDLLQSVLKLLLEERVSIRNLPLILEAIAEARGLGQPEMICEHVRRRLGFQLVAEFRREDGTLPMLQLAPEWEQTFAKHQIDADRGSPEIALPPELFNRLAGNISERLARSGEKGVFPAVITSGRRRRFVKTVAQARGITAPVLSFEEIAADAKPALVGMVPA